MPSANSARVCDTPCPVAVRKRAQRCPQAPTSASDAGQEVLANLNELPPCFSVLADLARGLYSFMDKGVRFPTDAFEEETLVQLSVELQISPPVFSASPSRRNLELMDLVNDLQRLAGAPTYTETDIVKALRKEVRRG